MARLSIAGIFSIAVTLIAIENYAQDFHVSLISQKHDLPREVINDVYEDENGYLWVVSDDGLYRFNGKNFSKIDEGGFHSFSLFNDSVVFAVGYNRVVKLDSDEQPTVVLNHIGHSGFSSIYAIAFGHKENSGWTLTDQGVFHFSNGEFSKLPLSGIGETYSECVLSISGDTLQLLTPRGLMYNWKNNLPVKSNILFGLVGGNLVNSSESFNQGRVLLDSNQIILINKRQEISKYEVAGFPSNARINDVSMWKERMLVASSEGLWLGKIHKAKFTFEKILDGNEPHRTSDLPFSEIRKIFCSKEGNIWAVCREGIGLLQERPFRRLSKTVPLASFEQCAFMENGKIYMESDNGIFECTRNEQGEYRGKLSPVSHNQIVAALTTKGNRLWISGLDYSVYYFEEGNYSKHISVNERGNSVFFMLPDRKGNVWVSQAPGNKPIIGILKITPDLEIIDYGKDSGFENRMLVTRESTDGVIYCAGIGEDTYLYRYDSTQDRFYNISVPMTFDYGENFEVHDMAIGMNGEIWLASTVGLLKFANSTIEKIVIDELYDNEAVAVIMAKDGTVWFSTDRSGVVRYDKVRYTIFNQKAGLASNSMAYRSINISDDGTIWASSQEGLFISPVSSQQWRKTKTPLMLGVSNSKGEKIEATTFPYREPLNFEFTSLTYPVESIEYSYRLLGFNNDRWTTLPKNDSLVLTNLSNGNYTLEIRAKQVGGYEWSDPRAYRFRVEKVWYLQTQALLVYFLSAVIAIIFGVRVYNRRLRREKKILERKVTERTIEISNKNEEISAQIEELKQMSDEIATQRDNLVRQKEVIENQNHLLEKSKSELECLVIERTKDLSLSNQELVKQNVQLEQFAFMTAHNLRAPVAQLLGLAHIFDRNTEPDSFNTEVIRRIYDSALSLDEVIRDISMILHVKKGINVTFMKIDLTEVLKNVLESFKEDIQQKKINVVSKVVSPIFISTIEPYLQSVFRNIISNSIKYTNCQKNPRITIESTEAGDQVNLIITDNGIGFDTKNNRDKLFKPFSRFNLSNEGKGLGLYLIKIEMDAMHGLVNIESEENNGTKVTLTFIKYNERSLADTL